MKTFAKFAGSVALGTFALATLLCGVASLWTGDAMGAAVCLFAIVGAGTLTDGLLGW